MIGTHVGNYRIVEKLGDGGMGAVYRAVDELLDREVAVKVLRSELAGNAMLIQRFKAEAIALARLNHPRIATLHGLERNGENFVMIMEYVRGDTLEQLVQRSGKLSWVRAVEICIDICDALDHAHDRGVVHRDIKPANVMMSNTGLIKVMDFGIARVVGRDRQTQFGHAVGTPMYMAPEQLRGEEVDGRADLYALGAVLFELLTGAMVFEADSDYTLMMKQLSDAPPAPSRLVSDVPESVDAIVLAAMAKSRDDRPSSAAVMRGALREALRGGARSVAHGAMPATRIAPEAMPATRIAQEAMPATRIADEAMPATRIAQDVMPATRISKPVAGVPAIDYPAHSTNGSWLSREGQRWRGDRTRWAVAAMLVVAVGASTAKFLSAKPDGGAASGVGDTTRVAVKPDSNRSRPTFVADAPALPSRQAVALPKVGSLQEVGGGNGAPPPPAAGGGRSAKPRDNSGETGTGTPGVPSPTVPSPRAQAPRESVVPAPVATRSEASTSAARFKGAVDKQVERFVQAIREHDVATVERYLLASGTNRSVHDQLITLVRAGRVEVSDVAVSSASREDGGATAQFDATLNFRSPFGANRKTPTQFVLDLGDESDSWSLKSARVIGSPKFK